MKWDLERFIRNQITHSKIISQADDFETYKKLWHIFLNPRKGKTVTLKIQGIDLTCRDDEAFHLIGEQLVNEDYPDIDIPENAAILDIGANIGFFSMLRAKANPNAKFICYEPNPETYSILNENIKNNHFGNISAINWAIFPNAKTVKLFKHENLTHSVVNEGIEFIEVKASDFDNAIMAFNPYLVKMDVEGAEYEIIKESKLLSVLKVLFIEIHDMHSPEKKQEILSKLGENMEFKSVKNNVYHYEAKK